MSVGYLCFSEINGPLIIVEGMEGAFYDEIVEFSVKRKLPGAMYAGEAVPGTVPGRNESGTLTSESGSKTVSEAVPGGKESRALAQKKLGRIVALDEDKAVIEVFESTTDMSLTNTCTRLTGRPMEIGLSEEILGRTFDGLGRPLDGLGTVKTEAFRDVNGQPMNPCSREYPRDYIHTGISAIDGLTTLIRGQKLPIFSGNGLPHDRLAAQIVEQASLGEDSGSSFAVVFAAMGVSYDVAEYFRRTFEECGVSDHVVMYLNLSSDPVAERLITPKMALTAAEYLAFEKSMHILIILTDMTSYAEAMREISSLKGEIPSRKGYPGYLYSELAALYERAGIIKGIDGSVTQIPILTMPNDDITHPIPDLTGYITEGQIVLERSLHQKNIYPPISVLPSLSRLMKDGIGTKYTREDHQDVANQLFSSYARVGEVRNLAGVIGEDELSPADRKYLTFGNAFEQEFVGQERNENRSIRDTLNIGWKLLHILPREELDRMDTKILEKFWKNEDVENPKNI